MSIDYSQKIPNNVNLQENKTLQRALEHWQPAYLDWWNEMGPEKSQTTDVYLRTAISVDPKPEMPKITYATSTMRGASISGA